MGGAVTRGARRSILEGLALAIACALLLPAAPALGVSVSFVGPQQVVYDWATMRCDDGDVPDGPVQAFRDAAGQIQLITPSSVSKRMIGPNFDSLVRDCRILLVSSRDADPAHFDDVNWIGGTYTENGTDIYALVHMEYHGTEHPGACPGQIFNRCRYNGVTLAESHDGGSTYTETTAPSDLIVALPYRSVPDAGRYGFFSPSNMIKRGSYYYSMLLSTGYLGEDSGACLMRTQDLNDPGSWRAWDGGSFGVRFKNPYYEQVEPENQLCEPVSPDQILQMQRSLIFDTALNKYIVVGTSGKFDQARNQVVWGIYFSLSDDLVHWSTRQLLMETETIATHLCGDPDPIAYPSLIDRDSSDRNFRITDNTMDLYYTVIHYDAACQQTAQRNLLRVPIQFSP
jgi:hypothetical protein